MPLNPATANASVSPSTGPAHPHTRSTVANQTSKGRKEFVLLAATTVITSLALFAAVAFGVGAWVGMNFANKYAVGSYQLALWGTCHDHDVSRGFT